MPGLQTAKIQKTIYLAPSVDEEINAICERHRQSKNQVIIELLTHSLAIYKQGKPTKGRTLKHTLEETSHG